MKCAPPEHPERQEMRKALRSIERHITGLKPDHQIAPSEIDQIRLMPMVLDENSKDGPAFFTPLDGSFLELPDDKYDKEWGNEYDTYDSLAGESRDPMICARATDHYLASYLSKYLYRKKPQGFEVVWSMLNLPRKDVYRDLYCWDFPEFGFNVVHQVKHGPYSHLMATTFNNLNGHDDTILRGELLPILRLMIGHLRRARFIDHMVAPILTLSFLGPQHARVIETYMEGHTVVVRKTKLYDLRTKDAVAFKTFAQWYLGKPRAPTGTSQ